MSARQESGRRCKLSLVPAAGRRSGTFLQGVGLACWAIVVAIKLLRVLAPAAGRTLLAGIAPSFLAAAGLFLVLVGGRGHGRSARLTLARTGVLVAAIALAVEFAQLLPRPGILARVYYTFDWLDVAASVAGAGAAWLLAWLVVRPARAVQAPGEP